MPESKSKYVLSAFFAAVIWGVFAIPLRHLKAFFPEEILYYRIFSSLIVIWLAIFIFRKKPLLADIAFFKISTPKQKRKLVLQIVGTTILLLLNWYSFIFAINNVSLKSGAFAYMVCPLLTAFGGYFILREHLSKLQFTSLFIALISIALLAKGSLTDVVWSIIIAIFYSAYLIMQRKMVGLDKLNVLAVQITICTLIILPFYFHSHEVFPTSFLFWSNILFIAIVLTVIPLFLSLFALTGIPSSTVGIIIYINPIIAFTVAIIYFDEQINIQQAFAYLLLFFAVFLFNWKLIKDIATFKIK